MFKVVPFNTNTVLLLLASNLLQNECIITTYLQESVYLKHNPQFLTTKLMAVFVAKYLEL